MSADQPVVLSPDRRHFWDGRSWRPAIISPDGRHCWNGAHWLPVGGRDENSPSPAPPGAGTSNRLYWAAVAICVGGGLAMILIGLLLPETLKKLVAAVAELPLFLIHTVRELLKDGKLKFGNPKDLVLQLRTTALRGPWWATAVMLGGLLAFLDNVVLILFQFLFGPLIIVLVVAGPVALGVVISRRALAPALGAVAVMAYAGAFFNSTLVAILNQLPPYIVIFGVLGGGTGLFFLGLVGYVGDRLWRSRSIQKPAREVILADAGNVYWDGIAWRPVLQLSENGRYVWNGQEWLHAASHQHQ